jgi:hypothetical protein
MTDPNIKPEPFDIDHDRGGWAYTDCDESTPTKRPDTRTYVHIDGPDFRTVEILDGKGQRVGRIMQTGPAIRLDGIDLSAVGTQTGRGQRARAVPFTDTPGPDGAGEKSGIMIEVPAVGWPDRWNESLSGDYRTTMIGRIICTVPNTEPGRRAAWAMEGA